jgi:hypothetical protein
VIRSGINFILNFEHKPSGTYIYLHKKATCGTVFYIGKGQSDRYISTNRTDYWKRVATKHGVIVEIVHEDLQEWYAMEIECLLISYYGRKDIKQGLLVNLTDGGDGAKGAIDTEICTITNYKTNEEFKGTRQDVKNKIGCSYASLYRTSKGSAIFRKGWYIPSEVTSEELALRLNAENGSYYACTDTSIKELINIDTLETFKGTRKEFYKYTNIDASVLFNGINKVRKRWTLMETYKTINTAKLKHQNHDCNQYVLLNITTGEIFKGRRDEFKNKFQINIQGLFGNQRAKVCLGWCIVE